MKQLFIIFSLLLIACQRKPANSLAADNLSNSSIPPMGASTYNDELKDELFILEQILDQKISKKTNLKIKDSLGSKKNSEQEKYIANIYMALPELIHNKEELKQNRKMWLRAKYLFLKRRFIESSILISEILRKEPNFYEAQNLRARALFFLGNPDLALKELDKIIEQNPNDEAILDALYLKGAIVFEAFEMDEIKIKMGILAWETYLAKTANTNIHEEIKTSLKELKNRLKQNNNVVSFAEANLIKARALIREGKVQEAMAEFDKINKISPSYAPGWHYRGMAHMLNGEIKEAINAWQKTIKLNPEYGRLNNLEQRIKVAESMIDANKISTH